MDAAKHSKAMKNEETMQGGGLGAMFGNPSGGHQGANNKALQYRWSDPTESFNLNLFPSLRMQKKMQYRWCQWIF